MDMYGEVTIVTTINGRIYRLSGPLGFPIDEMREVLKKFNEQVSEIEESMKMNEHQLVDKMAPAL